MSTETQLDYIKLAKSLAEALTCEPNEDVINVAREISNVFAGRNAEFVAIGFGAAIKYLSR